MRSGNIKESPSLLGYLEDIIEDTYYFYYFIDSTKGYLRSNNASIERALHSETRELMLIVNKSNSRRLVPNYYYDLTIVSEESERAHLVDQDSIQGFFEDIKYSSDFPIFVQATVNHDFTKSMSERLWNTKRTLEKLEALKKQLLQVFITGDIGGEMFRAWLERKAYFKDALNLYLAQSDLSVYDISGFRDVLKSIIPNFEIEKYRGDQDGERLWYDRFKNALIDIRDYRDETINNSNVKRDPVKLWRMYQILLENKGIGEASMSTLLNILNPKHFPLYTRKLSEYLQIVGFDIKNSDFGGSNPATRYNNYQIGMNQMFGSFNALLGEDIDGYDAVNYFIKNNLNLYKL